MAQEDKYNLPEGFVKAVEALMSHENVGKLIDEVWITRLPELTPIEKFADDLWELRPECTSIEDIPALNEWIDHVWEACRVVTKPYSGEKEYTRYVELLRKVKPEEEGKDWKPYYGTDGFRQLGRAILPDGRVVQYFDTEHCWR